MMAAALNRVSPIGIYETRHLLNGLVGILGLIGCWKLGRAVAGPRAGFIAISAADFDPELLRADVQQSEGHTVCGRHRLEHLLHGPDRAGAAAAAFRDCWSSSVLAIGMTMGVRIGGLLLLCYLSLLLALDGIWRAVAANRVGVLVGTAWISFWRVLLPVVGVAYPVMLVFWPWAQTDPIENPLRALAFFSHQIFPVLHVVRRPVCPGERPAVDLSPDLYRPGAARARSGPVALAPVAAAVALWRGNFRLSREQALASFVLGFGIVFPVAYAIAIKAVLFDGMRHFIFVLPLIAVAAAVVADQGSRLAVTVPVPAAGLGRARCFTAARIFRSWRCCTPTNTSTTMPLSAGSRAPSTSSSSIIGPTPMPRRCTGWKIICAPSMAPISRSANSPSRSAGRRSRRAIISRPNFRFVRERAQADFFIAFTKDNCERSLPGRPVYRVERMGALLSLVLDRRELRRGADGPRSRPRSASPSRPIPGSPRALNLPPSP